MFFRIFIIELGKARQTPRVKLEPPPITDIVIKAILGKTIKYLRSSKGLTQAVLAEKAEISIIFLSSNIHYYA